MIIISPRHYTVAERLLQGNVLLGAPSTAIHRSPIPHPERSARHAAKRACIDAGTRRSTQLSSHRKPTARNALLNGKQTYLDPKILLILNFSIWASCLKRDCSQHEEVGQTWLCRLNLCVSQRCSYTVWRRYVGAHIVPFGNRASVTASWRWELARRVRDSSPMGSTCECGFRRRSTIRGSTQHSRHQCYIRDSMVTQ